MIQETFKNKKILVVGGAGFVGSNLTLKLLENDPAEVLVVDNLLSSEASNVPVANNVRFIYGSITDDAILRSLPNDLDYVFHLACYHGNQSSMANPLADHENNTLTSLKLFERLKDQIDDLWIDLEGRLILAESNTGKILRISKDARKLENLADSYDGYRLSRVQGLMGSGNGKLFIGSPNTATIYQLDTKSGKLLVLNENLIRPEDFATNSAGDRLLVAESRPNRIVVYDVNKSAPMRKSWDLIKFTKPHERPLSINFIDQESEVLAVLTARGKKL